MWTIHRCPIGKGVLFPATTCAPTSEKAYVLARAFRELDPSWYYHVQNYTRDGEQTDYFLMRKLQTNRHKWRNRYETEVPYSPRENYLRTCGDAGDGDRGPSS
jgi:hypothetical protein